MRNRIEEIKAKGFDLIQGNRDAADFTEGATGYTPIDYSKIKVGAKTLEDAVLRLGNLKKVNPRFTDKSTVLNAINNYDLKLMREISDFYYKTNGIYTRIVRYMAFMYRYDWFVTPFVNDEKLSKDKQLIPFNKVLSVLDKFEVKKNLGEIALKVIRDGAYYGYKIETNGTFVLQELPVNYCRSRWKRGGKPTVEFHMKFFDDFFRDTSQRMTVLKAFPAEFSKGYALYKQGKLPPAFQGDEQGWYLLDPDMTVRFTANGEEYPEFMSIIPLIIDLDEAQEVDRKRTLQRLLKIVIQKLPLDKNGDLIFDVDEGQQLHNNAVQMLSRAIGVDVLTTFADTSVESLSDTSVAASQSDDLERVTNQIYTQAGVSLQQFNSDNSTALEKSIANDAATMYNMLLQFEDFLNELIEKYNNKRIEFRVQLLTTTIYNYQEMAKLYKEQMQLGFSKLLPQIALGQTQSAILANAFFENETLDLINVFVPPLSSNVMNGDTISKLKNGGKITDSNEGAGRPTNESQGKVTSEKTAANKEAAANN